MTKHSIPRRLFCHALPLVYAASCLPFVEGGAWATESQAEESNVMPPFPLETAFSLPNITGNPFDYTQNDVKVMFREGGRNGRTYVVPAFFDGGTTWRARSLPPQSGHYAVVAIARNGISVPLAEAAPNPATFDLTIDATRRRGFIRRDSREATRLCFEDGSTYYPMGCNAAWGRGGHDEYLLGVLEKLATRGRADWARVWMNHWDGKNLDWETGKKGQFDQLDLEAARRWDRIVETAGKHGLYLQITLQHHGPYSTKVDSNWGENPWNKANGGFLGTPGEFFTSERARALTRAKYAYILARWGWSPNVLAWELFNEVQWCDPISDKRPEVVVAWHKEMADFLRTHDVHQHLVTTSSDTGITGLYDAVDYVQPHTYPTDIVSAVTAPDPVYKGKPYFFGEFGPQGKADTAKLRETFHRGLWASLTTPAAGAAQFWYWDAVDDNDMYSVLRSASDFVRTVVGPDVLMRLQPTSAITIATPNDPGSASAGPGAGWASAKRTEFAALPGGEITDISEMPAFLQGKNHKEMFPHADFSVNYETAGRFQVIVRQSARLGAHLRVLVDGVVAAEHDFPAAADDSVAHTVVSAVVPAGRHVVRLENTGTDWVVLDRITLSPYGSALRVLARADASHALVYLTRPESGGKGALSPIRGASVTIPGFATGKYRIRWWDTAAGRVLADETKTVGAKDGGVLRLAAPVIVGSDLAMFVDGIR